MKISNLKIANVSLKSLFFSLILIVAIACTKKSTPIISDKDKGSVEQEQIKKKLQVQEDRKIDILHTELELSFDWENQKVIGLATLTVKPFLDNINEFYLDAKNMDIRSVELPNITGYEMSHKYDGNRIYFRSNNPLERTNVMTISISYEAIPGNYIDSVSPENKGLFFIDPLDTIPGLMPQIWTQGESEFNSIWFPTLDRPDEKFTQEIFLTVDTVYTTLSNGSLIAKTFNNDGTRTDYWKQEKPHSPYLTMIAVGAWEVIEMESNSVPLYIYTEDDYKGSMKDVFANTNEMINFYSSLLNYPFPWDKYAQIPVRKFVTGAMENTSASVFMENLYVDKKYLVDENFDWIISHELMHQWFGDLVTAESWSQIAMNESFANYAEFLWAEYKYGDEEAGLIRLAELDEYFTETKSYRAPIIRYRYNHPDEMFDAHSYSKGGLVLHMLRNKLGDKLFFEGLNRFLKKHKYSTIEISDFRKILEEVSGQDLNVFFKQWFEKPGHPEISVNYKEREDTKLEVEIRQTQKTEEFFFPLEMSYLYSKEKSVDTTVFVDSRNHKFIWKVPSFNGTLVLDPRNILLADISIDKTYEKLILQYRSSEKFLNRYSAFQLLLDSFPEKIKNTGQAQEFLDDPSNTIQELTINFIESNYDLITGDTEAKIRSLANASKKSYVRGAALSALFMKSDTDSSFYLPFLNDSSWYVNAVALDALIEIKKDEAVKEKMVNDFSESNNPHIVSIVSAYYAGKEKDMSKWFIDKTRNLNEQDKYAILGYYGLGIRNADSTIQNEGINYLYHVATTDEYTFNRVMAYQSLLVFVDKPKVKNKLIEILDREDSVAIKNWISSLMKGS